ncbi:MAG: cytochrome c biogenesis protein ResB [Pyrinomonadaceae bacterium]
MHVALLTIFAGGFLTSQFGRTGQMPLRPGETSSEMNEVVFNLDQPARSAVPLPFEVTCTDIQQKLIKKDGDITANNTIDWLTRIKIKDESGEHEALVHMNKPHDYRGYRFFQASFINMGRARNITLRLTPAGAERRKMSPYRAMAAPSLPTAQNLALKNFFRTSQWLDAK